MCSFLHCVVQAKESSTNVTSPPWTKTVNKANSLYSLSICGAVMNKENGLKLKQTPLLPRSAHELLDTRKSFKSNGKLLMNKKIRCTVQSD